MLVRVMHISNEKTDGRVLLCVLAQFCDLIPVEVRMLVDDDLICEDIDLADCDDSFAYVKRIAFQVAGKVSEGHVVTSLRVPRSYGQRQLPNESGSMIPRPKGMLQASSPLQERLLAEVLAIKVQQVKRIENDAVRLPPHRSA